MSVITRAHVYLPLTKVVESEVSNTQLVEGSFSVCCLCFKHLKVSFKLLNH